MFVILKHRRNPDIAGGYWQPPVDPARATKVAIGSLDEASRIVRDYIERNGLGGGNFPMARVTDASRRKIAEVSYNGRVWDLDGKPIELAAKGGVA